MNRRYFIGLSLSSLAGYYATTYCNGIPQQILADAKTLVEKNVPKINFDLEQYPPSKERKP